MYSFLPLFILAVIPSTCEDLHEKTCNVVPKDQYIEVGSDTELVCQSSCVHGKIYWTLNNDVLNESPTSTSKTINSSHTVLSLRNFTHHRATLQCHSADTQQVLGGTTISTYSKPSKISCILHYQNQATEGIPELFTCNWEHQIDSSLEINYTVLCDSSSSPPQSEICNSHETICTAIYGNIAEEIPLVGNSNIIVRAKSAAWEASSNPHEFKPLNILKITYPKLRVTVSDHLLAEWNITSRIPKKYHCEVKYSKAGDEGTPVVLSKTLENKTVKGKMTINNVESCTNYTIAVRCALDEAPWSDWSPKTVVLTKLNKSDVKLRLWRKIDEVDKNGVRKVHAMWSEIPSTCQDTFTYTIKQTPYKEHVTGINYTDTLCANSICDVDVNQDAHRIRLRVFHNEALFMEDSYVYVPAIGESLPRVTNIQTLTLKGVILVSWTAPVQPVSGYVIDYTHNGNQYYWEETKYTNATLFDLLDKKTYNITVTPVFDDKTGHGTQALKICSRVGDPGNVTIFKIHARDKSADVSWNVKSQEACSGVVVNYTVFYSTEMQPELNVTVDSTKQNIILKDLNPETQYRVCIVATALTGTTKSSEKFFKTKRFDPRLISTLSISGSILTVLVLSLGLCCAIQWKKFKEKPVPNPGHSSVALWPSPSHDKRICPFQLSASSPESVCGMIYTEEAQGASTSPLPAGCSFNPVSEQTEEYIDPAIVLAPDPQNEDPVEAVETERQGTSSPGESTELLSSENSPSSPYRSQSSVEFPAPRTTKQYKHVPVKQQDKASQLTVYVSVDMFEQGQGR